MDVSRKESAPSGMECGNRFGSQPPACDGRSSSTADGFSLHAAVRIEAHDRKRLERLYRYITRPALSEERIQVNAAGQVQLELKTPWRDGTTHLVLSPLEFMQRAARSLFNPLACRLQRVSRAPGR